MDSDEQPLEPQKQPPPPQQQPTADAPTAAVVAAGEATERQREEVRRVLAAGTYYAVLDVGNDASTRDVTKAYRKACAPSVQAAD